MAEIEGAQGVHSALGEKIEEVEMSCGFRLTWAVFALTGVLASSLTIAKGQEKAPAPAGQPGAETSPIVFTPPAPAPGEKPLPINLPTALQLANAQAIDVQLASERIRVAAAQLDRARVLWLPNILIGPDYFRHDGLIQDTAGTVTGVSKGAFMLGASPTAVFAVTDAIYAPLVTRQVMQARQADWQAAANDSTLAVAEAYFTVQQARGELSGAIDAARRTEELLRRVEELAKNLASPVEVSRAQTELADRWQIVQTAYARWRTASAELVRLLRIDPGVLVEPQEPPQLQVCLIAAERPVDELIPMALMNRPELASQQALVQATLEGLRQERLRPLVPSLLLRGAATNPAGTLAGGLFGGGRNESLGSFGARSDFDVQLLWQWENLGCGNRARVDERRAEHRLALLEKFRTQDRVAAEVVDAHARLQDAAARVGYAEGGLKNALDSAVKNFEGLGQTKRAGNLLVLVIRPQEALTTVQALDRAYSNYYRSIADFNRGQYRLYRALGQPAQLVSEHPSPEIMPDSAGAAPGQFLPPQSPDPKK